MFFLFSLGFYHKTTRTVTKLETHLPSFSFDKGGNYSFQMTCEQPNTKLMFFLTTTKAMIKFNIKSIDTQNPCETTDYLSDLNKTFEFTSSVKTIEWNGTANDKVLLRPVLLLCNVISKDTKYTLVSKFANPKTLLDFRWAPSFYIKPVTMACFVAVFLFMFLNIFKFHKNASRYNMIVLTSTFFLLLNTLFSYLELRHNDKSDDHTPFRELSITAFFIGRVLILMAILLGSQGWEIINPEYSKLYILKMAILSIILFAVTAINSNINLSNYAIAFVIVQLLTLIVLTRNIIRNINKIELMIKGHLYVISQRGIDPSSTPIYHQFLTYHKYEGFVLVYLFFIHTNTMFTWLIDAFPYWCLDFISEFSDIFITCASAILFRSVRNISSGYSNIDAQEVYLEDIESLGIQDDLFQNHSLTKWEDGMDLPRMPTLLPTRLQDEDPHQTQEHIDENFDTSNL